MKRSIDVLSGGNVVPLRAALVSMPFVSTDRPSIQLGLLQAIGRAAGAHVDTFALNLDFARLVGRDDFETLCRFRGRQVGEWLFSVAAYGEEAPDPSAAFLSEFRVEIEALLSEMGADRDFAWLSRVRDVLVPAYLSAMECSIDWASYDVVGFTSTFQQTLASLALASRIKTLAPNIKIVFGGANFDGEMGVEHMEANSFIDYAVVGEGDVAFPALLDALQKGEGLASVPNLARREGGQVAAGVRASPFDKLDALPTPVYDDFFERTLALGVHSREALAKMDIPFESARGCWWGAKHHCVFCGLNADGMTFRAKSPARVLSELSTLSRRYKAFRFEAVDNIMDPKYIDQVFGFLQEAEYDWEFFFEVKSNLKRKQLERLARGGVNRIQPGIESLDTRILKLMRKGVTGIQNVNLLRWALHYGIRVSWNLLWGFAGEKAEYYEDQASMMRSLVHLQPPDGGGRIWMERYSPVFQDGLTFLTTKKEPEASYRFLFPKRVNLNRVAYFFSYRFSAHLEEEAYESCQRAMLDWKQSWADDQRPSLEYRWAPGVLRIDDRRVPSEKGRYEFEGELADLYVAISDGPGTPKSLVRQFGARDPGEIEEALNGFVDRGLAMHESGRYLALALPKAGRFVS